MPPDYTKLSRLQTKRPSQTTALPAGTNMAARLSTTNFGDTANEVGAMRLAEGAASALSAVIQRGLAMRQSDKTIDRQADRLMALFADKQGPSGTSLSPRTFSASAAAGGLKENFGNLVRESTNSFTKNPQVQGWWDRALASRGEQGTAWSFTKDTGLGYTPPAQKPTGWDYSGTDESRSTISSTPGAPIPQYTAEEFSGFADMATQMYVPPAGMEAAALRIGQTRSDTTSSLFKTPEELRGGIDVTSAAVASPQVQQWMADQELKRSNWYKVPGV